MSSNRNEVRRLAGAVACALSVGVFVGGAQADPVNATLSATYFEVLHGTGGPDFGGSGFPNVAPGSTLGPNGFPVVIAGDEGISEFNPTTEEITWWSPAMNSAVQQTGTGTIALPYSSTMYPLNSGGTSDSAAFETAMFSGNFSLSTASTVSFQLGSDDDSFIYVDDTLIGQNPGIHGVTNVDFTSGVLGVGAHTIDVFFADREETGAFLSLNLLSQGVVITPTSVPEPSSWGLMLAGMGLVGVVARRRRSGST